MQGIEFEIDRVVEAPFEEVYARLVDIDGYDKWTAGTKTILKHTHQTSPGKPAVGTTFVDETTQGDMPGEIEAMDAPHSVVFHWWDPTRSGRHKFDGWPTFQLLSTGDGRTLVRHTGRLVPHGLWRLGKPIWRRMALRERTITVDALQESFAHHREDAAPALDSVSSAGGRRHAFAFAARAAAHS